MSGRMPDGDPGRNGFQERALRTVQAVCLLGAVALLSPQSEYGNPADAGPQLPAATQAFDSITMAPDPSGEPLERTKETSAEASATPESAPPTVSRSSEMPQPHPVEPGAMGKPMELPETELTHPTTTTSTVAPSKPKPEKPAMPNVPAAKPTYFIAPGILDSVRAVGEVVSDHNDDGSWTITPPEDTNEELSMVWWWSEHSKIGTDMTGTGYLYAHHCLHASIECAGDNFEKLRVGDKIKVPTENGVVELTVTKDPQTLPKTAEGIGNSDIYDYDRPGVVWLITCGYQKDGVSDINRAVETRVTNATTKKYTPSND
jgi:hypothetical protein